MMIRQIQLMEVGVNNGNLIQTGATFTRQLCSRATAFDGVNPATSVSQVSSDCTAPCTNLKHLSRTWKFQAAKEIGP
jgi:hypothetical protein